MIADSLKNARDYFALGENFQKAFEYLMKNNLEDKAEGKYEIDGDNIFVIVQSYDAKPKAKESLKPTENMRTFSSSSKERKNRLCKRGKTSPTTDYDNEKILFF
jgi:YhcH/YjgK/YiaL family protein